VAIATDTRGNPALFDPFRSDSIAGPAVGDEVILSPFSALEEVIIPIRKCLQALTGRALDMPVERSPSQGSGS
jgi:hypothetical protein